ncbi:MAG: site-specific integrase [Planctomycetes bacterium]|nr:site-specific integrase [Planctomycetota bacterium]
MSKRSPTLRRHKRSGHAYARLDGRQVWFGPYDDPETHQRFSRTLAEWTANGRRLPPSRHADKMRVADLVASYLEFAQRFYCRPDGTPTREVENLRDAVRPLLALYGTLPVGEFGIRQLKTVREQLIARGLARKTINDRVNRMVRLFGWATEEELCGAEVYGALRALRALKRGRSAAKEGKRVMPVSWAHVEAVLPHLTRQVAGLVELMWHTGMRPGEACQLRVADLDRSGTVWFYRPRTHKSEHHGRERVIPLGPRAQDVLKKFTARVPAPDPELPLFSPRDALAEMRAARKQARRTPLWPSHERRQARDRKRQPEKQPSESYTPNSLQGAVRRACVSAGVLLWSPNQLRHAAATRIRKERGLEAARTVLGHASAAVTEIYAEIDTQLAAKTMAELG